MLAAAFSGVLDVPELELEDALEDDSLEPPPLSLEDELSDEVVDSFVFLAPLDPFRLSVL